MFSIPTLQSRFLKLTALALLVTGVTTSAMAEKEITGDPYSLSTCPVSGEIIEPDSEAITHNHNGREIRFCCDDCVKEYKVNPKQYVKTIDNKMTQNQLPYYPFGSCVVSGKTFTRDNKPINYIHHNRLVLLADKESVGKFKKSPGQYLKKLDEAVIEQQKENYPIENCPISGMKLGSMGEPVDMVIANHLVRLCCDGCVKTVRKNAPMYIATIDEARGMGKKFKGTGEGECSGGKPAGECGGEQKKGCGDDAGCGDKGKSDCDDKGKSDCGDKGKSDCGDKKDCEGKSDCDDKGKSDCDSKNDCDSKKKCDG